MVCAPSMVPCCSSGVTLRCVRVPRFPQASASPPVRGARGNEATKGRWDPRGGFEASVSTPSPEGGPPLLFAGRRRRSTSPLPGPGAFPSSLALKNTARHSKARQHNLETTWRDCAVSRVRDSLYRLARARPRVLSVLPQNAQKHHKSHNNGAQGHAGPRRRVLPLLATARARFVHPLAITLARHSTHSRPCAQRALCNTRVLCQPSREIGQRRVARRVRVRRG